jgi:predicted metal-dependent hydrolase
MSYHHREHARRFVHIRIHELNAGYNFSFNRIAIRNQKSRWGSCSKQKNLNFNYRIALLPARLADYIIVHELCHLQELNHSQNFWALVGRAVPNHRELRRQLRTIKLR